MITDKFVHVHLPRTGGSTVRAHMGMLAEAGRLKVLGEFSERSVRAIPFLEKLFKFGFVRNPWAWYVSRYHWGIHRRFDLGQHAPDGQMTRGTMEGIWNAHNRQSAVPFDQWLRRGFDSDKLRGAADLYRSNEKGRHPFIEGWPKEPFFSLSACFRDMFCNAKGGMLLDYLGRLETIRADMVAIYDLTGVKVDDLFPFQKLAFEKKTDHKPYAEYYDDELAGLVAITDADLIQRFAYKFEKTLDSQET